MDALRGKHRIEVLHQFAGKLVGLHPGNARSGQQFGCGACPAAGANRIAQYEMWYRIPQKPLLEKMAGALNVSAMALAEGGNGAAVDALEQLFWWNEEVPGIIHLVFTQRETTQYNKNLDFSLRYDDNDKWPPRCPTEMWFDDTILDDFLRDWAVIQKRLQLGEITQHEYFEWKIRWPEN